MVRRADVWLGVRDSRQAKKVEHDRVDLRGVAVCAVLSGADPFVEIEAWGKEKRDWLRKSLRLEQGIACHDTFGRVFAARDADEFAATFLRWVGQGVRALAKDEDEKTAIPERLAILALEGCLITIDAMGTQPNTA